MTGRRVPEHAVQIWSEDRTLWVCFTGPDGASHTISAPADSRGAGVLFRVLAEREHHGRGKIAERTDPTQWDFDRLVAAFTPMAAKARSPALNLELLRRKT